MPECFIKIPRNQVKESNYFTATAYFRSGDAASAPTTARYRVDCLTTGKNITAWTDITPAVSANLTIGPNTMSYDGNNNERKQITVEADSGLTTQNQATRTYIVLNNNAY